MQFQSCYTSFDAQDCAETECNLKLFRTSGSRAVYSCCCRSNLCNAHLIYPAIQNGTNPLIPDTLPVTTDGTIDREGTVTSTTGSGMCMYGRERAREEGREREGEGERSVYVCMCVCVGGGVYIRVCTNVCISAVNPNLFMCNLIIVSLFAFVWLIDSPTKRLSRWMLLILAATVVAVFMLTVIITCVIIQERKACFSKVNCVTYM